MFEVAISQLEEAFMDGDSKVWSVIMLLVALVGISYYGTYRLGYHRGKIQTYKEIVPKLIEMTETTYSEAYSDGQKSCDNLLHGEER